MFFIVNHEHSIIAADADFLEEIGAESIYEAALLFKNGDVLIDTAEHTIALRQNDYSFSSTALSTFLGAMTLYRLESEAETTSRDEEILLAPLSDAESLSEEHDNLTSPDIPDIEEELLSLTEETETPDIVEKEEMPEEIAALSDVPQEEAQEEYFGIKEGIAGVAAAGAAAHALMDEAQEEEAQEEEPLSEEEIRKAVDEALLALKEEEAESSEASPEESSEESPETPEDETEPLPTLKEEDEEPLFSLKTEEEADDDAPIALKASDDAQEEILTIDELADEIPTLSIQEETEPMPLMEEPLSTLEETLTIEEEAPESISESEASAVEEESDATPSTTQESESSINITELATLIGVSEAEYSHFLQDFQKESVRLESHLRSNDLRESREAISTLKEASLLLHLPHITEKLDELTNATSAEKEEIIDSYLLLVSRLQGATAVSEKADKEISADIQEEVAQAPALQESAEKPSDTETLSLIEDTEAVSTAKVDEAVGSDEAVEAAVAPAAFNLEEIQPIPFDFSVNQAADELTLPASLVSEFIVDFINQAKENIPVLQQAYEEKDLEKIQKTAHMLKGASSNLRITPMADTLYNLQFNDNLERVPELLSLFTGQLKALAIQMDQV